MDGMRLAWGLVLSSAIGGLAWWRGSLTASGWLGAILTGTVTLGFGGFAWAGALVAFFVTSSLLSHYKEAAKQIELAAKTEKGARRDFGQAMANGGLGSLLAVIAGLTGHTQPWLAVFAGVLATVTADTWATEIGVLSLSVPRLITTGRPVERGVSGGVSLLGTGASLLGALFIGVCLSGLLWWETGANEWRLVGAALIGGALGSLADSLLGATVQAHYKRADGSLTERAIERDGTALALARGWRWMTNDVVNFLSSMIGGLVAMLIAR